MGTFFEVKDIQDFEFGEIVELSDNSESVIITTPRKEYLSVWKEFLEAFGIEENFRIQKSSNIVFPTTSYKNNRDYTPSITETLHPVAKVISHAYARRLTELRDPEKDFSLWKSPTRVPMIDREKLMSFTNESAPTQNQLLQAFLDDLVEENPEVVDELSLKERQSFEVAMQKYADEKANAAQQRLIEAKQTALAAEAIEEEAHRKTDAALGAEAAAEGLERLTKHWHDKIQHHQLRRASNFMWFAITLVAALFLFGLNQTGILQAIVLQLCNNDSLCPTPWQNFWQDAYLTAKGNTSWLWAILSLKGILLPVLGVAWLLRIFSRQNASHFALENDARQRLALLVSYVRLQENPDTKLTEEERILFLRTLFRTAEVSSKEDAQPNMVELIGKLKP